MTPPFMAAFLNGNDDKQPPAFAYGAAFPEFFDEGKGFPPLWPMSERSVQNAEASIVDAFIRTVFGWRPDWGTWNSSSSSSSAAIDSALLLPASPRPGFQGVLRNVRTPFGAIDITAGESGLTWEFSSS